MAASIQASRYIFTLNNYEEGVNYENHFTQFTFIKRVVFGYEVAPETGTPHLQGYLEYQRSQRVAVCRRVLPEARWARATQCSLTNYRYCTKSGAYGTVGDWSREREGIAAVGGNCNGPAASKPLSAPMIIGGLLNEKTVAQVKVSKEYSEKYSYYDKISTFMHKTIFNKESFSKWQQYLLYPWQYEVSAYLQSNTNLLG